MNLSGTVRGFTGFPEAGLLCGSGPGAGNPVAPWGGAAGLPGAGPRQPTISEQAKVISNFAVAGPAIGLLISGAPIPSPVTV